MENRDLQGSWGGATVRQDYAMMMMIDEVMDPNFTGLAKAVYKQDVCSKCPLNDWRTQR